LQNCLAVKNPPKFAGKLSLSTEMGLPPCFTPERDCQGNQQINFWSFSTVRPSSKNILYNGLPVLI